MSDELMVEKFQWRQFTIEGESGLEEALGHIDDEEMGADFMNHMRGVNSNADEVVMKVLREKFNEAGAEHIAGHLGITLKVDDEDEDEDEEEKKPEARRENRVVSSFHLDPVSFQWVELPEAADVFCVRSSIKGFRGSVIIDPTVNKKKFYFIICTGESNLDSYVREIPPKDGHRWDFRWINDVDLDQNTRLHVFEAY